MNAIRQGRAEGIEHLVATLKGRRGFCVYFYPVFSSKLIVHLNLLELSEWGEGTHHAIQRK